MRTLLAAVVTALLASLLVASPAAAATPTLAIESQYANAIYADPIGPAGIRDTVGFAGVLTDVADQPVVGQELVLERRLTNQADFEPVGSGVTDSNGRVVLYVPAQGNAVYRFTYAGDGVTYDPAVSANKALKVQRDFNARKVTNKGNIFLRGNINPGWGGRNVTLQKKSCGTCAWKNVGGAKSSATGAWSLRAAYPPLGKVWRFRARIPAEGLFVASTSAVLITKTIRK